MDKQIITFTANEQCLRKTGGLEVFATKTVSYIEAHFDLGDNWSGYDSVRAVWWNDYVRPISTVLDSDGVCIVPTEVLLRKGTVYVNLVGSIAEGDVLTDRLTTIPITALVEKFNAHVDSTETAPITPSQFEQFVEAVKADADRAEDAKDDARGYASDAQTYAENASTSATNASTSEDNAKASELNAETYKNQAQTYAQNANNSAISAENAKDEAEDARDTILGMRAEATTLPEGSSATASYNDGVMSFGIPKGDKGDKGNTGETGAPAGFGTVSATVDSSVGTPSVEVTASGADTAKNFAFAFHNLKGQKGDKGDTGDVSQAQLDAAVSDLKSDLNDIQSRVNLFDKTKITLGFHKQDIGTPYGTARGASGDEDNYFYSALIPVDGSETIWTNSVFTGVHPIYVLEFDSNELVIASHTNYNTSFVTNANAKYICFSSRQSEIDENMISRKRLDYYRSYADCDILSSQLVRKAVGNLTDSKYLISGYIFRGDLTNVFPYYTNESYTVSHLISVGDNDKVVFINNSSVVGYCMLRAAIEGGAKTQITIAANGKTEVDLSGYNYFAFEMQTASILQLSAYFYDEYSDTDALNDYLDKMMLKGLNIVFDGDSVTEGAGVTEVTTGISPNNNKGWGYSIQNICKDSNCYGFGKSGWRIGKIANESPSTSLLEHISQYPEDVDVFVLSGGYNDQAQQMALGEIVEHKYYTATYDEYTTIGALESWICQLRQAYPLAKIMYVITGTRTFPSDDDALPTNRDTKGNIITDLYSTQNERFELFFNSIEKVLNKWGIPYVDLRKEAGIEGTGEPTVPINIQMWENAGGLHPTKICYDTHLVPKILNKIRSII